MTLSLGQFIDKYTGIYAYAPGGIGRQCMDLANLWSANIGGPHLYGNAIDVLGQAPGFYSIVGSPQPGDLVIFSRAVGPYGHISIFVGGNTTFDCNWPLYHTCQLVPHNFGQVAGFMRANNKLGGDDIVDADMVNKLFAGFYNEPVAPEEHAMLDGKVSAKALINTLSAGDNPRRQNILNALAEADLARREHWGDRLIKAEPRVVELEAALAKCKGG